MIESKQVDNSSIIIRYFKSSLSVTDRINRHTKHESMEALDSTNLLTSPGQHSVGYATQSGGTM